MDDYIKALLEERAGYVARDNKDGVAEVDAELARVGHKPAGATAAKKREKATDEAPRETREA